MEGDVDFGDAAESAVFFEAFSAAAEGVFDDFVLEAMSKIFSMRIERLENTLI